MAEARPQSYANHRRFVPAFHFLTFGILGLNLVWRLYQLWRHPGAEAGVDLLLAVALILIALYARVFALRAQDRVIRLEERLRLARLLPAELQPRIEELSPSQLIALRFASDEEAAELACAVLDERLRSRDQIKQRIRSWRADRMRV
jgi:hypothetical protein